MANKCSNNADCLVLPDGRAPYTNNKGSHINIPKSKVQMSSSIVNNHLRKSIEKT